ncbi:MAG: SDR family NAD(P)-dependent oxidoreductase [Mariniphaga sp.]|nr:SDR family NAD(P)-dependent oxidoreductase [Mariniphaga sp.]
MKENWTTNNIPDLKGKVIIVTGGNSGLGYWSVKAFAEKGAEVVLASRSKENGEKAKTEILSEVPKGNIIVAELDLADLESVRRFAKNFQQKHSQLDVLLNNAGIMTTPYFKTKDGFEGQIGTNHLGHFALTGLLLPVIEKTSGSRVVNVSSMAHKQGKMDFDNFLFENGKGYSPMKSYGRSKLANLLFTYELQRFFESNKIESIAVAAHPGVSQTNLSRHLEDKLLFKILYPVFKIMTQDAEMGALPQIRASVDPHVKGGEYYGPSGFMELKGYPVKVQSNGLSHDVEDAKMLWEVSKELTGVKY